MHIRKVQKLYPELDLGDLAENWVDPVTATPSTGIFHWRGEGCGATRYGSDFTKAGTILAAASVPTAASGIGATTTSIP